MDKDLDGPTGTGKVAITREITEKLSLPFVSTSVTNYSATGYVGGDITDILKELYNTADGDIEKAQRGIVVFDEFDKIAYSRNSGLEMKRAVQQQLFDFLGGGKYNIRVGNSIFDMKEIEFDTSKLTFVCLAALTDLRTLKTKKNDQLVLDKKMLSI
ncbi:MAG: AAA domain-containing protein [Mollicutes bacterium]|jgi:ATP-dependent Clp protease ATP-binding subunit ClpX|nr:AAA domain-containing protein [Mollicutes bacterium]